MKLATCTQIREAETRAIDAGVSAYTLMETAASGIADAIIQQTDARNEDIFCIAYIGKGNNAGDALSVLRRLMAHGWNVHIRSAYASEDMEGLCQLQWEKFHDAEASTLTTELDVTAEPTLLHRKLADIPRMPIVIIDGLLGSGVDGPLKPAIAELVQEINELRHTCSNAIVWAIDIPTGVQPDTGEIGKDAVQADYTACIGCIKPGLIADTATSHVGRLVPVPLNDLDIQPEYNDEIIDSPLLSRLLVRRPYELYKNKAGRVAVIAGSIGMLGAAQLCTEAALRAGAGLVVLYCLPETYPLLAARVSPEIMVKQVQSYKNIDEDDAQALLIGPGLGQLDNANQLALHALVSCFDGTVVLDADGINLAAERGWRFEKNHILTPHPGEMRRLLPSAGINTPRKELVNGFLYNHDATLVLKGARTVIGQRRQGMLYNSTGGPAMAKGGQGDVLAGVCAGLAAQGIAPRDAAALAVYLCGRASELAVSRGKSGHERTLTAGDTLRHLGAAMQSTADLCY